MKISTEGLENELRNISRRYEEEVSMNFMGSIYHDLEEEYKKQFEKEEIQKAFLRILFT